MLDLIKAHPWTCAVGGLIMLGAIVGVIVAIVTKGRWKDRGLMKTDDGKPYKWSKENFPLTVWLHPDLPDVYYNAFQAARRTLHQFASSVLFDIGTELPGNFDLKRLGEGQVVLGMAEAVNPDNPDHGNTSLTVMPTGEIKNAVVSFPPARDALAAPITLHEMLHVLGFDHDESTLSIMHPRLQQRPQRITDEDKDRLKSVTDTSFRSGAV